MKNGSRWTQNWKNKASSKIHDFFHFLLVYKWKMKKSWLFWVSQLIFDEKPLKNHDFWIFVVTKNAKIVIFDWFLCKKWFFEKCHSSFLLKNQWKIVDFLILKFQKMQKHYFFHRFCENAKFWQVHLSIVRKKFFSGWSRWPKKWV